MTRISQDNGMAGDIAVHVRSRGNEDIVPDRDASDDGGIYADPYAISQNGCAFSLASIFLTNGHALMQVTVRADDGGLVDRDVEGVSEVEPWTDLSSASYLQAVFLSHAMQN